MMARPSIIRESRKAGLKKSRDSGILATSVSHEDQTQPPAEKFPKSKLTKFGTWSAAALAVTLAALENLDKALDFLEVAGQRYERAKNVFYRANSPPPSESQIETGSIERPNASTNCAEPRTISGAHRVLGSSDNASMVTRFNDTLNGRQICDPGWPAILQSITIDPVSGRKTVVVSDPRNSSRKLQFTTSDSLWGIPDGASVSVTAILTSVSERGYLVGDNGAVAHREITPKPRPVIGQQDDATKMRQGSEPSFWKKMLSPNSVDSNSTAGPDSK